MNLEISLKMKEFERGTATFGPRTPTGPPPKSKASGRSGGGIADAVNPIPAYICSKVNKAAMADHDPFPMRSEEVSFSSFWAAQITLAALLVHKICTG